MSTELKELLAERGVPMHILDYRKDADFRGLHLENLDLSNTDFPLKQDAQKTDFRGCFMREVCLDGARLTGADFRGATLDGVEFRGARIGDVDFGGAVIDACNLRACIAERASFSAAARFGPSWSPEGGNECSLSVHKGRAYGSLGCIPINGLSRSSLAAMVSENIFAIFAHELERLGAIPASTIRRLTETVVEISKLNWVEDELILGDPQPGGLPGLKAWIDDLLFNET